MGVDAGRPRTGLIDCPAALSPVNGQQALQPWRRMLRGDFLTPASVLIFRAGVAEQRLDDDNIPPSVWRTNMSLVRADLTEARLRQHGAAGEIPREDAAGHLVQARVFGRGHECRHEQSTDSKALAVGRDVHGKLSHSGVLLEAEVRHGRRPADHSTFSLRDEPGVLGPSRCHPLEHGLGRRKPTHDGC